MSFLLCLLRLAECVQIRRCGKETYRKGRRMSSKLKKDQHVRVLATVFDSEEGKDAQGRLYSEQWARKGHGSYCGGIVTRVLVKQRGKPQNYKIKWDDGSTMNCEEQHIEQALESDSEDDSEAGRDGEYDSDRNAHNGDTDSVDEEGKVPEQEQEETKTDS